MQAIAGTWPAWGVVRLLSVMVSARGNRVIYNHYTQQIGGLREGEEQRGLAPCESCYFFIFIAYSSASVLSFIENSLTVS